MNTAPVITLQHSWCGKSLPPHQWVRFELEQRPKGLLLDFVAPFYNDPAPGVEAGSCPGLWDYEVVEFFVAHGPRYTEIELGPHGHHLVLCLDGYRQVISEGHAIRYKAATLPGRWLGTALIPWELLPPQPWHYNAYAIHGSGATRSYIARHPVPGSAPDFHRLQHFQPFPLPVFNAEAATGSP
ncbi:MAG: hypothetical protein IGS03_02170 [Candidatus Sericytochromatia bacterium]|nr:hypothetical protein [Candidatus Sericytochromatia bacterium]